MNSTTAQTTTGRTTQVDESSTATGQTARSEHTTAAHTQPDNRTTNQATRSKRAADSNSHDGRTAGHSVRGTLTATVRDHGRPGVLAAFRVVVSFLFLCHGLQGFGLLGGIDGAGLAVPFGQWPGWWAGVIEVVGALFVLAGFATRPAAVLLSGTMA
ncbi:MAG: DoxX family protein, partial [Acidimicrobiales bacterium]